MKDDPWVQFRGDIAWREVQDECYFLSADSMFHAVVDAVGVHVLKRVSQSQRVLLSHLVDAVVEEFDVKPQRAWEDIGKFVEELVDKNILEMVKHTKETG